MRWTLALLALALLPAASASQENPAGGAYADPDAEVSPDDCQDCATVDLVAGTTPPSNCADCVHYAVHLRVEYDGDDATVTAQACRGGFVYICVVDEEVTL